VYNISTAFQKIRRATSRVSALQKKFHFVNLALKLQLHYLVKFASFISAVYDSTMMQECVTDWTHLMQSWNTSKIYVAATSGNDLLLYEHRHPVTFTTGQIIVSSTTLSWTPAEVLITLCRRSTTSCIGVWQTRSYVTPKCSNQPCLMFGLFGGHMSGAVSLGFSRRSSSTVWRAQWYSAFSCWKM